MKTSVKGRPMLSVMVGLFLFIPAFCEDSVEQEPEDLQKLLDVKINTAAKYTQSISEAPASVTIITAEEIERFGCRTLDEILMRVKGFYITYDRNYSYVGVRGFSRPTDYNNRVLILLNGNATTDNIWGSTFIGTELGLDVDVIERIEIVRGPGSALYGTNAMLAVINIITKDGKALDGLRLTVQPGSYGKIQGGFHFGKESKNGLDFLVSGRCGKIDGADLYFEEYDEPATNNGIAEGLDWDEYYGIFTSLKYKNFSMQGIFSSREKGIPTASYETIFNDDRHKTLDQWRFIELKYRGNISYNKKIMVRGHFNHYVFEGAYPYEESLWGERSIGKWFGLETQFDWDIRPDNRLIVGAEYKKHFRALYHSWDEEGDYFNQDFPFFQWAAFIQDEYQILDNLSFTVGIRYDKYSDRKGSVNPRAALIFNLSKSTTLKLLYGNAYRAPSIYEIYYESEDEAKANPSIKPEKIMTIEAVLEQQFGKGVLGILSLYRFEMKGLIEQWLDPSDELLQFQNIEKVRGTGIEAGLNVQLKNGFRGYVNYIFQNSKNVQLDETISNSPAHVFKLGVSVPVFKHFFASLETFYESSRRTVQETRTAPFLLTNIHFSSEPLFRHFKFSFQIRNLFDTEYRTPAGYEHFQTSLVQPGRTFTLKVELIF